MRKLKFSSALIFLIIIAGLSFWVRLWGIQFGLPFAYHPDEQQYILPAVGVTHGHFEPRAYYNPTLYPYFIGLIYTLTYLALRLFNAFPDFFNLDAAWSQAMLPWISGLVYLARYTSVAAGVLTTLMVYRLGRRAYSRATGVGAAIIFGLSFLPAREAHFAVSDAPVALGVAVTLYLCLNILERGHTSDYLWTGLAFGLATAIKYSAGLLILPIGAAHLLSRRYYYSTWSERLASVWLLAAAGLIAIVSYLLVSPYTLIKLDSFWTYFSQNLQSAQQGFSGLDLDPAGGAIFYLKGLIWGFGWPLFLLFLIAVLFALWRRQRSDLVLLILPLLGFFYMQRQEMYFVRWLMPFLPPMAVLAAETVHAGIGRLLAERAWLRLSFNWLATRPVGSVTIVIIFLLTLPSTYIALYADYVFSQPDTRTEALHWIQENIPPGSNLAAELLSPPWGPPLAMPGLAVGPYNYAPVPGKGIGERDFQQYRQWRVQYVIASSFYYARPLHDKAHQAEVAANLKSLEDKAELVALFQPYSREYHGFFYHDQVYGPANDALYRKQPGPIIRIYRLP